jgi:flagellar basal body-associated protein FliL
MTEQAKPVHRTNSGAIALILACVALHIAVLAAGLWVGAQSQELDARAAEHEYLRGRKEGSDAVFAAVKKLLDEGKLRYTP